MSWTDLDESLLSVEEIGEGCLSSQVEITAEGQVSHPQTLKPCSRYIPKKSRSSVVFVLWLEIFSTQDRLPDYFIFFKLIINFATYFFPIQSDVEVRNETVRGFTLQVCHLKPDTLYTFRLRHRHKDSRAPWSKWSNGWQGRTRESGERTETRDKHACLCRSDI